MATVATSSRPIAAAILGGISAGAIDSAFAIVASGAKDVSAARVLQSVASGLLGPDSYRGGWPTAVVGTLLHFAMTIAMAAIFIAAARRSALLRQQLLIAGVAYGVLIYFAMRWVVVPLSRFPGDLRTLNAVELAIHAFGVGLVIALVARLLGAIPAQAGHRPAHGLP